MPKKNVPDLLTEYIANVNIAENYRAVNKDLSLNVIGTMVFNEYKADEQSREDSGWKKRNERGLDLARQVSKGRKYAGETVADVKYPTIASAAIQYAARAYPAIVKDGEVVKYKPVGSDPEGQKAARGERVAQYTNWQILEQTENWDEDTDKLLFLQPILGVYYRKTYYDPVERKLCSELVHPEDLVMYYYSSSFEKAPRKTHIISMTYNEFVEQVRAGYFTDYDEIRKPDDMSDGGMMTFYEQHRTLDLDNDGYEEPYVVTIESEANKVVRIAARYDSAGVKLNQRDEVIRIEPIEFFTEYPFMPSFDNGIYGMGFGILLGPLNESINTLFNQLLDAGTRSNYQSGFIGRGARLLRGGESGTIRFRRGEWKQINATGDDLRKSIFPLPASEPSTVLFQLLGFLVQASKELASQSDLLAGQQEQHNVPATSTLALIEQGLQVFAGVYKRVYRALCKEYKIIHRYNSLNISNEEYLNIIDDQKADVSDFVIRDFDIVPVSTSATVTSSQKYLKAQALLPMMNQGLDDMEIKKFYLEAIEVPDSARFMPKQQPPPPPQFILAMRELDIKEKDLQLKAAEVQMKDAETAAKIQEIRNRCIKLRADAMKAIAQAEGEEAGSQMKQYEGQMIALLEQIYKMEQLEAQRKKEAAQQQAAAQQAAAAAQQQGGVNNAQPDGRGMGGPANVPAGAAPAPTNT